MSVTYRLWGQPIDMAGNKIKNMIVEHSKFDTINNAQQAAYLNETAKFAYNSDTKRIHYHNGEATSFIKQLAHIDDVGSKTFVGLSDTPSSITANSYLMGSGSELVWRTGAQLWASIKPATSSLNANTGIFMINSGEIIGPNPVTLQHEIGNGWRHIPMNGSNNQVLAYDVEGQAKWLDFDGAHHRNLLGGSLHALVTTSTHGFMSSTDKVKLDGIANNANNYSHPTGFSNQPATALTGIGLISQILVNTNGHVTGVTTRNLTSSNIQAITLGVQLDGLNPTSGVIIATDTILTGFNKAQGQINTLNQLVTTGVINRPPVRVIFINGGHNQTTTNLTTGTNVIDGVTVTAGMRVLVRTSSTAGQVNKIYLSSGSAGSWSWAVQQDSTGADLPGEGHTVWCGEGHTFADTKWTFTSTEWIQIGGSNLYVSGTGIAITGNQIGFADFQSNSIWFKNNGAGPPVNTTATQSTILHWPNGASGLQWQKIGDDVISNTANIALSKLAPLTGGPGPVIANASGVLELAVNNILPMSMGGTGTTVLNLHHIIIGGPSNTLTGLAPAATGRFVRSTNTNSAPEYSAYSLPASVTANRILFASSTSEVSQITSGYGTANKTLTTTATGSHHYRPISGISNRTVVTWLENDITVNVHTDLLPSPLVGHIGYVLTATGANTATWQALTVTHLPQVIVKRKDITLSSASNSFTVNKSGADGHGFDDLVSATIWQPGTTQRVMEVDVAWNHSTKVLTLFSAQNWPAGSKLIVTGC